MNWNAAIEKSTTPGAAEMMKPFRRGRYNLAQLAESMGYYRGIGDTVGCAAGTP